MIQETFGETAPPQNTTGNGRRGEENAAKDLFKPIFRSWISMVSAEPGQYLSGLNSGPTGDLLAPESGPAPIAGQLTKTLKRRGLEQEDVGQDPNVIPDNAQPIPAPTMGIFILNEHQVSVLDRIGADTR